MTLKGKKTVLIVLRHTPYGSSLAKAALDTVLATAAFEQTVDLLFLGDGVLQLLPEQDSRALGRKNFGHQLASLPLYDINNVYVDAESAKSYNLDHSKTPFETRLLDSQAINQLMVEYDHLLGF